jgi:hypothetical protein
MDGPQKDAPEVFVLGELLTAIQCESCKSNGTGSTIFADVER